MGQILLLAGGKSAQNRLLKRDVTFQKNKHLFIRCFKKPVLHQITCMI